MIEVYSTTRKNIIEHVWILSLGVIIFIGGVLYFNYNFGIQNMQEHILWSLSIVLLFSIPTLVLHFQYYLKNKNTQLMIDYHNRSISVIQKGNVLEFTFDDIKYIRRVKELEYARRGTYFLPWGLFNYSVIYLNDDRKIVITSYIVTDFDLPIDDSKKKNFEVFYPFIV